MITTLIIYHHWQLNWKEAQVTDYTPICRKDMYNDDYTKPSPYAYDNTASNNTGVKDTGTHLWIIMINYCTMYHTISSCVMHVMLSHHYCAYI
jgi:hypothetical protein